MYKESTPRETRKGEGEAGQEPEGSKQGCDGGRQNSPGVRGTWQGKGYCRGAPTPEGIKTPWQFWFPAGARKEAPGTGGEAAKENSQLQAFEADANSRRGRGVRGHIRAVLCPLHHSLNLGVVWITPWPWEVEAKTGLSYSGDLGLSEGRVGSPPSVSIKGHCGMTKYLEVSNIVFQ